MKSVRSIVVFELAIQPGIDFIKYPFPIPQCLMNTSGVVTGEMAMTLVYDPPLDPTFGAEYCRRNVEVSLGTYLFDEKKKTMAHKGQVPIVPKDLATIHERALVENGFKWSPVKVYRRSMTKGVKGQTWRLKVSAQNRSDYYSDELQNLALVITIFDPNRREPVYNDVVLEMQKSGWVLQDLQLQQRIRQDLNS